MTEPIEKSYALAQGVRVRGYDDQAVVLVQPSGEVMVVSEVAEVALMRIKESPATLAEIVEAIVTNFDVTVDVATNDIADLLIELEGAKAIECR